MFNDNSKPIYLQIADRICDQILAGEYHEGDRLPSVREYAAQVQVNPNTMMRTYEILANDEIIFNKRGIGYFIADGAVAHVHTMRDHRFMSDELPDLFRRMHLLGIEPQQLSELYSQYLSTKSN